ncbi:uncharacterized protein LOC126092931 [Schistocerca cancellata]|uniref:uncharacterized protein LOC126092931 n=1 Tax=Schistocerca cancellata TaxID=274614 RepID=UPI0021185120|nr:uncharacterized protein LOC126092931 [Schistocerca cancellata]
MYDKLKAIYKRDASQRTRQLLQEFYVLKYNKTRDIGSNISALQNIVFELNGLQSEMMTDIMIIAKILSILPEEYKHFSTVWDTSHSGEKTMENLIARLIREEEQLKNNNQEESIAFDVGFNKSKIKDIICKNCGGRGHFARECKNPKQNECYSICKRNNHKEKECYFKNKNKIQEPKLRSFKPCTHCKKTNHKEDDCYFKNKDSERMSFCTFENMEEDLVKKIRNKTLRKKRSWNKGKISQEVNEKEDMVVVVDSACTGHLCNEVDKLTNVRHYDSIVKVAKQGGSMKIVATGNFVGDNCVLKDVMYVPELRRNLMSVNAITEKDCTVVFTKHSVQIYRGEIPVLKYKEQECC